MMHVTLVVVLALSLWDLLRPPSPWPWRRIAELGSPQQIRPVSRSEATTPPRQLQVGATSRPETVRVRRGSRHQSSTGVDERRGRHGDSTADMGLVIDLLVVALGAGHTLHTALGPVCGSAGSGPVAVALQGVAARVGNGVGLGEALRDLSADADPALRPLLSTLSSAERTGTPLVPALLRLGDAERARRRRQRQERVRRLPVVLMAPLVGLVLPAFVLLTIAPVLITIAHAGLIPAST